MYLLAVMATHNCKVKATTNLPSLIVGGVISRGRHLGKNPYKGGGGGNKKGVVKKAKNGHFRPFLAENSKNFRPSAKCFYHGRWGSIIVGISRNF